MIRTIRSDIEGRWGVKIDATHSIWPWIAEHAGFLLTRFEVGRDGKTAYERLKGKSAKVQGMSFAEGILWKRKRKGGPLGKLTCMWEDGIYLGVKATIAEIIVGNRNGVWLTRTVRKKKPAKERWDRRNLEMVVAVPWRKNENDPKMDGERLKSEVVTMDTECREKLEAEEHVPVPERVYISRENFGGIRIHSEVSGVYVVASGNCWTSAYGKLSKANRGGSEGQRRQRHMKEYQDRAAEKGTKRTNADQEEGRQQREHG